MDVVFEYKGAFNYISDGIVRVEIEENNDVIAFHLEDGNVFELNKNMITRIEKTEYFIDYVCSDGVTVSLDYPDQGL